MGKFTVLETAFSVYVWNAAWILTCHSGICHGQSQRAPDILSISSKCRMLPFAAT